MSTFQRNAYGEVRTPIYTWEDGSRVDIRWCSGEESSRYFLFVEANQGVEEESTITRGGFRPRSSGGVGRAGAIVTFSPLVPAEERMFHVHVSDEWRAKIAGFFLDLGGTQGFAFSPEVSSHDSPYPLWMSDEDWGRRVSVLTQGRMFEPDEEDPDRLVIVSNLSESRILQGGWNVYIMGPKDWRFVSGKERNYVKQVPNKTGEFGRPIVIRAQSAQKLVDKICEMFHILPESKREWWEKNRVERGTFVIPSPEEVEVFRILEEELPLLWPHETFVPWIEAQE